MSRYSSYPCGAHHANGDHNANGAGGPNGANGLWDNDAYATVRATQRSNRRLVLLTVMPAVVSVTCHSDQVLSPLAVHNLRTKGPVLMRTPGPGSG